MNNEEIRQLLLPYTMPQIEELGEQFIKTFYPGASVAECGYLQAGLCVLGVKLRFPCVIFGPGREERRNLPYCSKEGVYLSCVDVFRKFDIKVGIIKSGRIVRLFRVEA